MPTFGIESNRKMKERLGPLGWITDNVALSVVV
jgi:hypothetical protein